MPLVKNAKLELPVDSNEPLSPQHFNFQDSYWGDDYSYPYAHQYTNEQSTYIYDINNDNDYTHNNTRVMRNTPVTIMKEELKNLLNSIMKTIVLSTTRRKKVSFVKKMR